MRTYVDESLVDLGEIRRGWPPREVPAAPDRCCERCPRRDRPAAPRSRPAHARSSAANNSAGSPPPASQPAQRSRGRISGIRSCTRAQLADRRGGQHAAGEHRLGTPGRPDAGEGQRRAVRRASCRRPGAGCRTRIHSYHPSAGTRQRRRAKDGANAGEVATVSDRALIMRAPPRRSVAQGGTRPQRAVSSTRASRLCDTRTTGTGSVGATFQLGARSSVTSTRVEQVTEVGLAPRRRVPPAHGAQRYAFRHDPGGRECSAKLS